MLPSSSDDNHVITINNSSSNNHHSQQVVVDHSIQLVLGNKFTSKTQLIQQVCTELNFPLDSIINLYLVGSRLYNCHDENSDYDLFMIIHNDFTLPLIDQVKWFETENDKILLESQKEIIQQDEILIRNENCISYRSNLLDINIYKKKQFEFELKYFLDQSLFEIASLSYYGNESALKNEIHHLERVKNCILIENEIYFITNLQSDIEKSSFRSPFSRKSSNSYIKTKKKLCVEHDLKIGLKSMFHSMKILLFAIQILKFGFVNDFEQANSHYQFIMNSYFHVNDDNTTTNNEVNGENGKDDDNTTNNEVNGERNDEWYEKVWNQLDAKYKLVKKELEREFHLLAPKIGKQNKKNK